MAAVLEPAGLGELQADRLRRLVAAVRLHRRRYRRAVLAVQKELRGHLGNPPRPLTSEIDPPLTDAVVDVLGLRGEA
jgi:hypothetical protein